MARIETPAGFVEWEKRPHAVAEITDIVVRVDKRLQGHGRALVDAVIRQARRANVRYVYLFTEVNNVVARRFYTALGFQQVAHLEQFYSPVKGAIIYAMVLDA